MTEKTPGRLLAHRGHPELMAQAADDRSDDPEQDHDPSGRGPDGDPHRPGERVADERPAGGDLVGERQCQPEVGVEVDDPPGLVLEVPPRQLDRGDPRHHQKPEADRGGQKVRIGGEEEPELAEHAHLGRLRIAERDEHDVGGDQRQRPWRDPPVPTEEPVLPDGSLEPRQSGDEHQHDQHQVGAAEPGQASPGDEPASRGGRANRGSRR